MTVGTLFICTLNVYGAQVHMYMYNVTTGYAMFAFGGRADLLAPRPVLCRSRRIDVHITIGNSNETLHVPTIYRDTRGIPMSGHFAHKIIEGKKGFPGNYLTECYMLASNFGI